MPDDFDKRLSPAEIDSLVAYLRAQQGRNPNDHGRQPIAPGGLTYDRLVKSSAEPGNWPMYWGDYQATHYSPLNRDHQRERARLAGRHGPSRCSAARSWRARRWWWTA